MIHSLSRNIQRIEIIAKIRRVIKDRHVKTARLLAFNSLLYTVCRPVEECAIQS